LSYKDRRFIQIRGTAALCSKFGSGLMILDTTFICTSLVSSLVSGKRFIHALAIVRCAGMRSPRRWARLAFEMLAGFFHPRPASISRSLSRRRIEGCPLAWVSVLRWRLLVVTSRIAAANELRQ